MAVTTADTGKRLVVTTVWPEDVFDVQPQAEGVPPVEGFPSRLAIETCPRRWVHQFLGILLSIAAAMALHREDRLHA